MATRFYFPSDLESPITTAYDTAFWTPGHLDYAIRRGLSIVKTSSAFGNQVVMKDTVNTGGEYDLLRQYISAPLTAGGAINGTVKAQFRAMQSGSVATDAEEAISIRVVSGDGATIRGILFQESINVGPFETVLTNRAFAAAGYTDLTEVVASVGDRIVIEIGVFIGCAGTPCDPDIAIIEFGDNSASDLPENNTGTDQYCPWVELSQTLAFDVEGVSTAVVGSGGVKVGGAGVIAFLTPDIEAITGSGGVEVSGEGVVEFLDPDVLAVVGAGGVEVAGEGVIGFVSYGIEAVTGYGGVEAGGQGVIEFAYAASATLAVTGSGGVAVSGVGVIELLSSSTSLVEIIGSGGVTVGGLSIPAIGFVEYGGSTIMAVIGSGGVKVGGAGVIDLIPLNSTAWEVVGAGGVAVGGAGIVAFASPSLEDIIGSGGVVVGGSSTAVGFIEYNDTPLVAIVGSGGVRVGGAGVIELITYTVSETLVVTGTGGVAVGGAGVVEFLSPSTFAVIGSGGVVVGGVPATVEFVEYADSPLVVIVGSGGVRVGGAGVIDLVSIDSTTNLAVVGFGGVVAGGAGVVAFLTPSILEVIGSGGVIVGEFRAPEITVVGLVGSAGGLVAVVGSGDIEVGGTGVIAFTEFTETSVYAVPAPQSVVAADIVVGGGSIISFVSRQILEVIGEGGVVIGGGESIPPDVFETYVMTGARGEPSVYSNFNFNSYAKFRGKYYGAGAAGLYSLEGEDDAGEEIYPGVRIGMVNFGTDREKRIRLLRCGGETTGAQVRVSDGNGTADYADVERGRAKVSRKVQAREILIEISDFEELTHLEIVPMILYKR